jgi:hypothetical protein
VKKFEKVLKEFEFKSLDLIEFEKIEKEPHLPFRPAAHQPTPPLPAAARLSSFFFFFLCVADTPVPLVKPPPPSPSPRPFPSSVPSTVRHHDPRRA